MMLLRKAVPLRHVGLQTFTKLFLSSNVPANLQIVDAKIFDPVPEPKMKEEHYYFPLLNVPATIDVLKFGSTTGELAEPAPLVKKIFEVPIRTDIINDVIRYIRHKRRQPKKTKRINEIRGSTKKPYAQKGGGRSQIGHKRNSSVRGGAKAHGPRLRDYSIDLNRKVRALGTMMALSAKHREGNLIIVDKLECESHKTKDLYQTLAAHGLAEAKTLIVDHGIQENFKIASNNLKKTLVLERRHMNVYEILKKEKLVLSRRALDNIQETVMAQYNYAGRLRYFERSKEVLDAAAAFCADEANGYHAELAQRQAYLEEAYDYDDKDGNIDVVEDDEEEDGEEAEEEEETGESQEEEQKK